MVPRGYQERLVTNSLLCLFRVYLLVTTHLIEASKGRILGFNYQDSLGY
jgi:hypothetical protein